MILGVGEETDLLRAGGNQIRRWGGEKGGNYIQHTMTPPPPLSHTVMKENTTECKIVFTPGKREKKKKTMTSLW